MPWRNGPSRTSWRNAEHQARRARVLEAADYRCQIRNPGCTVFATIADHIIATALGGPDTIDNMQAACKTCSDHKTALESAEGRRRARARSKHPSEPHPGLTNQNHTV